MITLPGTIHLVRKDGKIIQATKQVQATLTAPLAPGQTEAESIPLTLEIGMTAEELIREARRLDDNRQ